MVELGYRKDYDPHKTKRAEKALQHTNMCKLLATRYNVDYQVWDIGYTGIIPKDLKGMAERLGVANPNKLLKDIHKIAVEHALLIISDRRAQERQLHATTAPSQPSERRHPCGHNRYRYTPVDRLHTKAPPR
jgi:hypothetical protein